MQLSLHNFHNFRNQCFAVICHVTAFRKSCFANFANTSFRKVSRVFARFHKYFFSHFTFVSQDSQVFANTSYARFRNSQFRKNSHNMFFVSQVSQSFRKRQIADDDHQTAALRRATKQGEATLADYAAALIACLAPDDALACHYATTHPERHPKRAAQDRGGPR